LACNANKIMRVGGGEVKGGREGDEKVNQKEGRRKSPF
jgi:hypothetical protein